MRLTEIREILNNNLESLIYTNTNAKQVGGTSFYRFYQLKSFRNAIEKIEKTEVFSLYIESIKSQSIFNNAQDTFDVDANEFTLLLKNTKAIIDAAQAFIDTVNNSLPENSENAISIKLPPSLTTFSELSRFFKDLEKAFAPIVDQGSSVSVEGFEPGSKWINIVLGLSLVVDVVGRLAWSGAVIAKKTQEYRMHEEDIQSMDLRNQLIEDLKEAHSKKLKQFIEAEAGAICKQTGKEYTQEEISRIKLSIETFSELILKGTEVHPSLNASEDVENLFPKDTPYNLIESKTKLLDENAGPSSK